MDELNITLTKTIIKNIFKEDKISVIFVSEHPTQNKRYPSKSKISKIINIRNWLETVVTDETTGEGEVYVTTWI